MPNKIELNQDVLGEIIERNKKGEGLRPLSLEYQISRSALKKRLSAAGFFPEKKTHNKVVISEVDLKVFTNRYLDGESLNSIAENTPFSASRVGNELVNSNVILRPQYPQLSAEEIENIVRRYQQGETLTEICDDLSHADFFIKKQLVSAGVKLRTRSEEIGRAHV